MFEQFGVTFNICNSFPILKIFALLRIQNQETPVYFFVNNLSVLILLMINFFCAAQEKLRLMQYTNLLS